MATLIFRSKSDNRFYSEASKPNGSGTWYVFFYDLRGRKVRKRVGSNKRIAEIARGDIEARLAKQRGGLLDPDQELTRVTVAAFCEKLPSFLCAENKAPKTQTRYEGVFRVFCKFLVSEEANVKFMDQIEAPAIERFKDFRRRTPVSRNGHPKSKKRSGVAVRTMNNELMFLRSLFNLAKRRGYLRRNPLDDVKRVDGQKRKHYQPLTREQIIKLLGAADTRSRPVWLTLLLTGMRTGELLNLEWADIDFVRDEIHIQAKESWQPKDKEARVVPLHSVLRDELEAMKTTSDSRYVFGKGNAPLANKLLRKLQQTCIRAGIPVITVHNLRDEFASHMVMSGVGIETVSRLLGHSDIQITWNHYVHLAPNRLKDAVEKLDWPETSRKK